MDVLMTTDFVPCKMKTEAENGIDQGFDVFRYTMVQTGTPVALPFWPFSGGKPFSVTVLTPNSGVSVTSKPRCEYRFLLRGVVASRYTGASFTIS